MRSFCDKQVLPIINGYWERAEFPFELVPKLAELGLAGGTIKGYGCPGLSQVAAGLVGMELARGDGSVCTFFGVHSGLAMQSIALLGSEEQRQRWLPAMARLDKIGAFALTEPQHGSDAVALDTRARRDGDHYVLDGAKRWIGNASFADLVIVWARDDDVLWFGEPPHDIHSQQGIGEPAWELVYFGSNPNTRPRAYFDPEAGIVTYADAAG